MPQGPHPQQSSLCSNCDAAGPHVPMVSDSLPPQFPARGLVSGKPTTLGRAACSSARAVARAPWIHFLKLIESFANSGEDDRRGRRRPGPGRQLRALRRGLLHRGRPPATREGAIVRTRAVSCVALLGPAPPLCAVPAVAPAAVTQVPRSRGPRTALPPSPATSRPWLGPRVAPGSWRAHSHARSTRAPPPLAPPQLCVKSDPWWGCPSG